MNLTPADINAINEMNAAYLVNKGAKYYTDEDYEKAVEYYRLAASMGDIHATSNLGYCYLYGRSIPKNVDLAISYFKIAANKGDVDAIYKLGDIYYREDWGKQDKEIALYYFEMGLAIFSDRLGSFLYDNKVVFEYPSLFLACGREMLPGGMMNTNLEAAYEYLRIAKKGFEDAIANGFGKYEEHLKEVNSLLRKNSKILADAKAHFGFKYEE